MSDTTHRTPRRAGRMAFAAAVALCTVLAAAPSASAEPMVDPPTPPPTAPKIEGQLKNVYSGLCLADGNTTKTGTLIRFEKCKTVNGGYTSAAQYFFLQAVVGGVEIKTLQRLCLGVQGSGNPESGDALVTKTCDPSNNTTDFTQIGGDSGVPYYFNANDTDYHPSTLAVGYKTDAVGAIVTLSPNQRNSGQAWHGSLVLTG